MSTHSCWTNPSPSLKEGLKSCQEQKQKALVSLVEQLRVLRAENCCSQLSSFEEESSHTDKDWGKSPSNIQVPDPIISILWAWLSSLPISSGSSLITLLINSFSLSVSLRTENPGYILGLWGNVSGATPHLRGFILKQVDQKESVIPVEKCISLGSRNPSPLLNLGQIIVPFWTSVFFFVKWTWHRIGTCVLSHLSCLTLCNAMDCILPGSSIHGILQARILE